MESRKLKISFNKSGRGTLTPKLALPIVFVRKMGITEEDRDIELIYDDDKKEIILKKLKNF